MPTGCIFPLFLAVVVVFYISWFVFAPSSLHGLHRGKTQLRERDSGTLQSLPTMGGPLHCANEITITLASQKAKKETPSGVGGGDSEAYPVAVGESASSGR